MRKLIKLLCIRNTVKDKIQEQEDLLKKSQEKSTKGMNSNERSSHWLNEVKIEYLIEELNKML